MSNEIKLLRFVRTWELANARIRTIRSSANMIPTWVVKQFGDLIAFGRLGVAVECVVHLGRRFLVLELIRWCLWKTRGTWDERNQYSRNRRWGRHGEQKKKEKKGIGIVRPKERVRGRRGQDERRSLTSFFGSRVVPGVGLPILLVAKLENFLRLLGCNVNKIRVSA